MRGVLARLSNTAATAIVSGTPGATGHKLHGRFEGTIENPAATNAMNFVVRRRTARRGNREARIGVPDLVGIRGDSAVWDVAGLQKLGAVLD